MNFNEPNILLEVRELVFIFAVSAERELVQNFLLFNFQVPSQLKDYTYVICL